MCLCLLISNKYKYYKQISTIIKTLYEPSFCFVPLWYHKKQIYKPEKFPYLWDRKWEHLIQRVIFIKKKNKKHFAICLLRVNIRGCKINIDYTIEEYDSFILVIGALIVK